MLAKKDQRTLQLIEKYQVIMPSFEMLPDADIDAVLSYMHTFVSQELENPIRLIALEDPIKDSIAFSPITADLDFVTQIPASAEEIPTARINKIQCANGSGRIFINDLRGDLYEIVEEKVHRYMSIKTLEKDFKDSPGFGTGFGSFAFHPNFEKNGLLYTTHSEAKAEKIADFALPDSLKSKLQWVVKEWQTDNPRASTFSGKSRELLRIDFFGFAHGMQEIAFNPKIKETDPDFGLLYIGLGDGLLAQRGIMDLAHHQGTKIWSSILCIDPTTKNAANGKYGIPIDNPFVEQKGKLSEIWAYGFRNPNRLTWDFEGNLFTSDIGQSHIEELNLVLPGKFYGWPIREGTFMIDPSDDIGYVYKLPDNDSDFMVTYPTLQYDHSEGAAISGGFFSKNYKYGNDHYVFGDIATGQLFLGKVSHPTSIKKLRVSLNDEPTDFKKLTKNGRVDLKLGEGCDGSIYVFTKTDGKIYRMRNL